MGIDGACSWGSAGAAVGADDEACGGAGGELVEVGEGLDGHGLHRTHATGFAGLGLDVLNQRTYVLTMGLVWRQVSGALRLGYLPGDDGPEHVGRVRLRRNHPNSWEAHYDRLGLLRHAGQGLSCRPRGDEAFRLHGSWPTAQQAAEAVDRHHAALARTQD